MRSSSLSWIRLKGFELFKSKWLEMFHVEQAICSLFA